MNGKTAVMAAVVALSASPALAEDSALVLGKSANGAHCALCHGANAEGGGEVGELFAVKPPNLTKLAERAGGRFPFSDVYHVVILGMEAPGHGPSEMPVWGDYFMADALEDRGVKPWDALEIAAGRALSLTLYLESIQD